MMNVKNGKCIRRLSFKALWALRKRNVIAVIAIALTTLLFTSLFTVVMSINAGYETYTFRQIGGYSHGTFKAVTDEQAKAIAGHSKVRAVGKRTVIGFADEGVFAKVPAEISYMDANCTKWSYTEPSTGHMPRNGKEIAMDTGALKLLGIEPELGVEITLSYTVGNKEQVSFAKTDTFVLTGWWEYDDISPVHCINISEEYADLVEAEGIATGMADFRTDLNVMMDSVVDIRGQMEQVDLDLGYSWESVGEENSVCIGVNWGYTTAQLGERLDAGTVLAVIAFLVLIIFTGYLIIYNVFQISVTGDVRFYGLLKTIGVTPRQLRRMIRLQAMFLCLLGIPAGLLFGYGVGAALTPVAMARTSFGVEVTTISASPFIFIASVVFALVTVLLSCARPGRLAAKVSPVEAAKYTENIQLKKKERHTRGSKVYQMAFANLGRNKSKTILVVISLALSVLLLNVLVIFTNGFDMERYLNKMTCADFIVGGNDYFKSAFNWNDYISDDLVEQIEANTSQTLTGCGYTLSETDTLSLMTEEAWRTEMGRFLSGDALDMALSQSSRKNNLVSERILIEGLDEALFDKINVVEGDLSALFQEEGDFIALEAYADDYGNATIPETFPAIGETLTVTYVQDAYYIDSRTGQKCDENTPEEFWEYYIAASRDVDYTICAYVTVPNSMSHRFGTAGYEAVLPARVLEKDSGQSVMPLFYLFDVPNKAAELEAENYLAGLTAGENSEWMYESKATLRAEFESFQRMFLLLGGLLCAIIGLVGMLNFFNAIMTGILSRRREFAVLQAVGMTSKQLKNMLVCEGLFYALGSVAVALVLSVLINPLAGKLLETMFWFFRVNFTIIPVLWTVPAFALMGWLIPTFMCGQATKSSVVERLRIAE